ncbi:MAG: hypothetical protein R3230_00715 [Nitrosopumilaceae archaeon]|nr:hypothetical protein [Nitrosopumilaceae archaeon]
MSNTAKSTSFLMTVGLDTNRQITLKIQSTNLGSVTINPAEMPARYSNIPFPGDKLEFSLLTTRFLLDEDLTEWLFLQDWIFAMANADFVKKDELFTNVEITVYDRNNQPTVRMTYHNAYPLTVSDIDYTLVGEEQNLTCSANFVYTHYTILNVKTGETIEYGN